MPVVFAEVGSIITQFVIQAGGSAVFAEAASAAIVTILEYAAVLELLNAAQHALAPSQKSGVGPGLFVGGDDV
jgi:hypothetical protein